MNVNRRTRLFRGGLGRLAAWHLPGGPVGPVSRWAATSNIEVGQTSYPVNRERIGREGREGSEGQRQKDYDRERGIGIGDGARDPQGGRVVLKFFVQGSPEFLVTPPLQGSVCLLG